MALDTIVTFTADNGETVDFTVIEETKINGKKYILVTENTDSDEEEALIMRDTSSDSDPEANYVIVEDKDELDAVAKVFSELLDGECELE